MMIVTIIKISTHFFFQLFKPGPCFFNASPKKPTRQAKAGKSTFRVDVVEDRQETRLLSALITGRSDPDALSVNSCSSGVAGTCGVRFNVLPLSLSLSLSLSLPERF